MPLKAVVFDVGNVLYDWQPHYLYDKLIADPVERAAFLQNVVTPEWHFQHDAGRPFAETSEELIARHPQHRELIAAWGPRFNESIAGPISGMPEIVAELVANGAPLYAITNFSGEFWPSFRSQEKTMFAHFRGIVVSGDERMTKPDAAIYRLALVRFALKPGEGLFVDDRVENVEAAVKHGFVGHHFIDAAALRSALIGLGLLAASLPQAPSMTY